MLSDTIHIVIERTCQKNHTILLRVIRITVPPTMNVPKVSYKVLPPKEFVFIAKSNARFLFRVLLLFFALPYHPSNYIFFLVLFFYQSEISRDPNESSYSSSSPDTRGFYLSRGPVPADRSLGPLAIVAEPNISDTPPPSEKVPPGTRRTRRPKLKTITTRMMKL